MDPLALTVAATVFGPWIAVTPQTMLAQVPEVYEQSPHIGSVQRKQSYQPLEGCPIYEEGRVVGFSLTCRKVKS